MRLSASIWKAQQKGKQVFREIFSLSNSQARIKVIRNKKESKCTENIFIRDCEPSNGQTNTSVNEKTQQPTYWL